MPTMLRTVPGQPLPISDAPVVVAVPLYGAHDLFVRCMRSLLAHTPVEIPIVIADDCGPDPASEAWLGELSAAGTLEHQVLWHRQPENLGWVGNCNALFRDAGRADVILVNSDLEVATGWFEGLQDAACADDRVATVTALTNDGTIVSVPERNRPQAGFPQNSTFEDAAARVMAASPRLRPDIPTAVGHCVWIRRAALDLVGGFDVAFAPAYGEEADFSQKCVLRGLRHIVADEVLVLHHGRGSLGVDGGLNPIQKAHEDILRSRYPFYAGAVADAESDQYSPLARSLAVAARAVRGLRVTIDGRCLGPLVTGTQIHVLELVGALARSGAARLRVVVPIDMGEAATAAFAVMQNVQVVTVAEVEEGLPLDDVAHRPYQASSASDLSFLHKLGRRVVITQQDLIGYHNPGYFTSGREWLAHRQLARETLALADRVLFFSDHAEREAEREQLVPKERAEVVLIGVDHQVLGVPAPALPDDAPTLTDKPFMLVLGTDFRHKNRLFALQLLGELVRTHGWDGRLVLAGPAISSGSSAGDEAAWLAANPELTSRVIALPAVSESFKAWLLAESAAVLYPTVYEGFGLLPFEAASAGTPCLFAHVTSISELLGDVPAVITPWDAVASAAAANEILTNPAAAQALLDGVRGAAAKLTWDATAQGLIRAYDQALVGSIRDARHFVEESLTADLRYWKFREAVGPTGLSLVEPRTGLLTTKSQRAIAALTRRRITRIPFLGLLHLFHKISNAGSLPPSPQDHPDEPETRLV